MDTNKKKLYIFAFLSSIFILNDFLFIYANDFLKWLFIDYSSRILAIVIIFYSIYKGVFNYSDLKLNKLNLKELTLYTFALSIVGILTFEILEPILDNFFKDTNFVTFPKITNEFVRIFDLTIGLILVALSEEFIFRALALKVLEKFSRINIILITSFIFSIIHWSTGVSSLIITFLIGTIFMIATLRVNSIYPVLLSHFIINFWLFV